MKPENVTCPTCGGPMVSRKSSFGVFWGCKAFPQCRGTRNADGEAKHNAVDREYLDESNGDDSLSPSMRQRLNDRRRWS